MTAPAVDVAVVDQGSTNDAPEVHTGGMISLVPTEPDKLVIPGGLPAEELHLTLAYLGDDVTTWPAENITTLLNEMSDLAHDVIPGPVHGRAMGHALFNPDGGPDGGREPCVVYLIGDAPGLPQIHAVVRGIVEHKEGVPEQHANYLPHVTAGYGIDPGHLSYAGPVVFDRLRVALAGQVTDFPLISDPAPFAYRISDEDVAVLEASMPPISDLVSNAEPELDDTQRTANPDGGSPDAAQLCSFGDTPHAATHSLLFAENTRYVAVCDTHDQNGHDVITASGEDVSTVIPVTR